MTPRYTDTKEEILRLGTELIQLYGYNAFSYADISKKLDMKNAAVHYHFPGKEDLFASIVQQYIDRYHELGKNLDRPGITAKQKIEAFISRYTALAEQNKICIIGSVCSDYNTLPHSVRAKMGELIDLVLSMVAKVLKEGKTNGEFHFEETPHTQSLLMMTNLAAGVQLSRITGQKDYTAICRSIIKQISN
ncbi:MAG: TetR/AcrR family transcriptional regulator [Bacteroidota bacterium]|nr:TetR/AcrR family transcriptional regulator [Bacteroidota bacterium]